MKKPLPIQNRILFEDNHIIVVNKLAGEIVQGDKTGDEPMSEALKTFLKKRDNKPGNVFMGVVHRIDRPTSGVLIFAKTSKALARLNQQFHDKESQKTYWALCLDAPAKPIGTLVHYLKKDSAKNKSFAITKEQTDYKKAVLHYKHLASSDHYHLLEIQLETGRHHQIRVQLSTIGCTIKGDLKYGAPRSNKDASISLHARTLTITHPTTKEVLSFTAPVPNDNLWQFFEGEVEG